MLTLNIEARNVFGKKLKKSRAEGKIPAVLYGKGKENTPLFVDLREFKKIWKKAEESTIIKLKNTSKSGVSEDVFIYDISVDPLKNEPLHVDFYVPEAGKPITAEVQAVFEGVAPAVKELGGVLVKVIHRFEIEALPKDFPREIKIDLSKLANIGDKMAVKDIVVPPGVKILAKNDAVIVLVKEREEEKAPEKEMNIEDIEVAKRGKKEEETEIEGKAKVAEMPEKTKKTERGTGKKSEK